MGVNTGQFTWVEIPVWKQIFEQQLEYQWLGDLEILSNLFPLVSNMFTYIHPSNIQYIPIEKFLFVGLFLGARDFEVDQIDKASILTRYRI